MAELNNEDTVLVGVYDDSVLANAALEKLSEASILAFTNSQNPIGLNPLGGIELRVFEKDEAAAKNILQALK
ncbi:MAG: hypothetical protein IPL97_02150 [Niastella sp.]|nr:hypothetical protein [Niastella sp.]